MSVQPIAIPIFDPAGVNALKTTNTVTILQGLNMHDTAVISLQGENMTAPELQPGTPVQIEYGYRPTDIDFFYGYIDHITSNYQRNVGDSAHYEDVVCIGESYVMKDPFVGAWTTIKASTLVGQIAATYKLGALIETDDYAWPSLSSTGCSAWSFLVALANKVGYTLAVNKDLLRFASVAAGMQQNWAGMPVFLSRKTAPTLSSQTISTFQALQGEATNLPGHTKAVRAINGIDPLSGQIVSASNDGTSLATLGVNRPYPFFTQQISDHVVTSQGHAQALLAGMASCNRFTYQACATLSGLTSVVQGVPIVISGVDVNNNGVWWVQEVKHKISSIGYTMDVSLGRDAVGDNGLRPTNSNAVMYSPQNPFAYALSNAPKTVLVQQRWRSATQFNVYVTGGSG
jgi:hypothetical protein